MKNLKVAIIVLVVACLVAAAFMFKGNKNSETEVVATPAVETKVQETAVISTPVAETKVEESVAKSVTEPVAEVIPAEEVKAEVVKTEVVKTEEVKTEEVKAEEPVEEVPAIDSPVAEETETEQTKVEAAEVETIIETTVETKVETTVETTVETIVETTVETKAETSVEVKTEVPAEEITAEAEPVVTEKIIDDSTFSVAAYISPFSFHGLYFKDYDVDTQRAHLLSTYGLGAKIKARYNFYNNCYVALDLSEQTYFEKHYDNMNDILFGVRIGHKNYFCEKAYTFAEAGIALDIASFDDEVKAYLDAVLEIGFGCAITDKLVAEVSEEVVYNYQKAHDGWLKADSFSFNTYIGLVYKF